MTDRPDPIHPVSLALASWRAGWPIVRCHRAHRPARQFNPTDTSQRFRPVHRPDGRVVATLYGADSLQGALAETILHDVPLSGDGRYVMSADLGAYSYSVLSATRPLELAVLHDPQVKRLGLRGNEIGACPPDCYPWTARWAQAIYDDAPQADGLVWVARNDNTSRAIMLFGGRVTPQDLKVERDRKPLASGVGRREVIRLLELADIALLDG